MHRSIRYFDALRVKVRREEELDAPDLGLHRKAWPVFKAWLRVAGVLGPTAFMVMLGSGLIAAPPSAAPIRSLDRATVPGISDSWRGTVPGKSVH